MHRWDVEEIKLHFSITSYLIEWYLVLIICYIRLWNLWYFVRVILGWLFMNNCIGPLDFSMFENNNEVFQSDGFHFGKLLKLNIILDLQLYLIYRLRVDLYKLIRWIYSTSSYLKVSWKLLIIFLSNDMIYTLLFTYSSFHLL